MSASSHYLDERNSYKFRFNLIDSETGLPVGLSSISTILMTQFYYNTKIGASDRFHLATINNRYNQNIKNLNDVTITASGTVTWEVQPEDTILLNSSLEEELHVSLVAWIYSGGKQNSHSFLMYTRKVPYISDIPG